jgi:hypothetical protein
MEVNVYSKSLQTGPTVSIYIQNSSTPLMISSDSYSSNDWIVPLLPVVLPANSIRYFLVNISMLDIFSGIQNGKYF